MLRSFLRACVIMAWVSVAAPAQPAGGAAETRPAAGPSSGRTVAQELGFGPTERLLIIHCDDAGMCHSANQGTIEAMTEGVANSASVMMPCPWVLEFIETCRQRPDLDVGLHLTLTSEWRHFRWRPVLPFTEVPGLIDPEGYLWRDVPSVALKATPDEVERELRAQVRRALDLGLKPTHLDTHMGTVFARPDFFAAYRKVALEFKLPYLLPRLTEEQLARRDALTRMTAGNILKQLGDSREFTLDDLKSIEGNVPLDGQKDYYAGVIRGLKPGITQIIIHCGVEGEELRAVTGSHARRDMDRRVFMDPDIRNLIEREGVRLITWREIGRRQRQYLGLHGGPGEERPDRAESK
ncbi:MAG: ChbG/HpnK family deacetylase [Phycisphaerae bacterium]|jgi:hypothetical protein